MSQENVEIVRRLLAASADRDVDAAMSMMHANIEWQIANDEPEVRTLHGHAEVIAMVAEWIGSFETVPLVFAGTPRGGAVPVKFDETQVYTTVRDRAIVKVRDFRTKLQAVKAVGLAE